MMIRRRPLFSLAIWLLLLSVSQAATVRWTGAAQDIRQVSTIAVTGTWATGDTATLTINNKSLTVTVGSSTSTSNVADIVARAVDALNDTEDLLGNESRNFGGEEIPEFAEIDASSSGATLTLSSETPGVPFTVTRTEVTAGDGALGAVTEVTAATGKNWLSNAANYSGGSIPVDNDTLIFDGGSVDVLYALDHFRTNSIDLNIFVSNDWTGQLGQPRDNPNGYTEYRTPRYFQYRGLSKVLRFVEGASATTGQGRCWVDLQDQTAVTIQVAANRGQATTTPTIFLAGSDATTALTALWVEKGVVLVEPDDADTATSKYFLVNEIDVGRVGAPGEASLHMGRNSRLAKAVSVQVHNGLFTAESELNDSVDDAPLEVFGGSAFVAPNTGTIDVHTSATVYPTGAGALGTVTLLGGTIDYRQGQGTATTALIKAHAGSAIFDPTGNNVVEVELIGTKLSQVTIDMEADQSIVFSDLP